MLFCENYASCLNFHFWNELINNVRVECLETPHFWGDLDIHWECLHSSSKCIFHVDKVIVAKIFQSCWILLRYHAQCMFSCVRKFLKEFEIVVSLIKFQGLLPTFTWAPHYKIYTTHILWLCWHQWWMNLRLRQLKNDLSFIPWNLLHLPP